ncbi:Dihydropteroate synthase [Calocera viscosa TUFC12733]|uniref:Folic acid synthesis protein FOL1 n=1 Tax=Calocera viscosa (strain TUFC12733) TaxID=1330018 RepID=A0A167KII4_CALVF|nr:Dihydropteroate synthase [Calocera viscosa TUFC12733]
MSRSLSTAPRPPDRILVSDLYVQTTLGSSLWPRPDAEMRKQPVSISISVPLSLSSAGSADTLADSISYGTICKAVERIARQEGAFGSAEDLAEGIADGCLDEFGSLSEVNVRVRKPRALLQAKSAGADITRRRTPSNVPEREDVYFLEDLALSTIIGMNPWERLEKQMVHLDISLFKPAPVRGIKLPEFDFRTLATRVSDHVLQSSYQTVESMATAVAQVSLSCDDDARAVTVKVAKPSALMFAGAAEVEITRTPADFAISPMSLTALGQSSGKHRAVIALGSNLGDRVTNIERALRELESAGVQVVDTSFMYETAAMYVEDQPKFLNAACVVETELEAGPLLQLLKKVEATVGRTKTYTNGPRVVDLDVIFFDNLDTRILAADNNGFELIVPHPRVQEREFVLRPLADIVPNLVHPSTRQAITSLLRSLVPGESPMYRVLCFPASSKTPPCTWPWSSRTYLMSIINSTPDSFSDGGVHFVSSLTDGFKEQLSSVVDRLHKAVDDGADILDIGGYSTRPGAAEVSEEEELARVVPLITQFRASGMHTPISVDTFRASVARAAIEAGANCINDVYAFSRDPEMVKVAHDFAVPVVMMHSRGDAGKEKDYSAQGGVMEGVRTELGEKIAGALRAGVRRWNIIADPGVGFSKTVEGNLTMLRDLRDFTAPATEPGRARHPLDCLPVLVGTSRKSFLGELTGTEEASERLLSTAVACTTAIQGGADIIRVHDTKEMRDVAKVADALWRRQ